MPSRLHQMIVGLIGRKMRERGYEIVAFDGNEYMFDGQEVKIPPAIGRHRPDIIGYDFETKGICVGEAKTQGDLSSSRTREQLHDYSTVRMHSDGQNMEIILGIPKSAENDLIRLLKRLGLYGKNYISYVWIPEDLINED